MEIQIVEPIRWWKSTTMWFNIASTVVELSQTFLVDPEFRLIPREYLFFVVTIGNILLRKFKTEQPIGTPNDEKK